MRYGRPEKVFFMRFYWDTGVTVPVGAFPQLHEETEPWPK